MPRKHAGQQRPDCSEATERRGELNHRLKLLAEDRQLGEKQLELEIVEQRLSEAVERWRVLAVTNLLLVAVASSTTRASAAGSA